MEVHDAILWGGLDNVLPHLHCESVVLDRSQSEQVLFALGWGFAAKRFHRWEHGHLRICLKRQRLLQDRVLVVAVLNI